ncbi:MAG TPA: cyd operon YbgE family protein [Noviherbaspirillum sp.]
MEPVRRASKPGSAAASPGIAWLPLLLAMAATLALTVYPHFVSDAAGRADHATAAIAMLGISAGFVRGVGFVPRHVLARWLFSTPVCLFGIGIAAGQFLLHR